MKKGAKINIFWNFLLQGSVEYPLQKISKNVDFSLWGEQCDFYKFHFVRILAHCAMPILRLAGWKLGEKKHIYITANSVS